MRKNVKILKYHNETKILHGLDDLLDKNPDSGSGEKPG
jgi:hypothetical protein